MDITHEELNQIACRWLKRPVSGNGAGCNVALTEVGGLFHGERADAWGYHWEYAFSVLVESKVSRSDFLADAKKPHRNGEILGMGTFRYYICPEHLIEPSDLPEKWGLLWVNSRGHVKLIKGHLEGKSHIQFGSLETDKLAWGFEENLRIEMQMMAHALGRVGDPEAMNKKIRDLQQKLNRAIKTAENIRNQNKLFNKW